MKNSVLMAISIILVSCGGGSGKDDIDPCEAFCIDLCNKAVVCGRAIDCNESWRIDNCTRNIQRPDLCPSDRNAIIGMSCGEFNYWTEKDI